jgi:acrylyl-CoA reductase (NADPH)
MPAKKKFKAFVIENDKKHGVKDIDLNFLMEGNVLVKVSYSSFNYKDGLAIVKKIPVIKKFPMIPGVDFSGKVIDSSHKKFKKGDKVILNGWGVGEKHFGGFSQYARVNGDWLIHLPENLNEKNSMIIGSAGYTAALCVLELRKKINPKDGKVIVTGASGGVGSIAVNLLSELGYYVVALSNKQKKFLFSLGAKEVLSRDEFKTNLKPLGKQKWIGCIDTVGGDILASIISEVKYDGIAVATGLAKSHLLNTTVYPFILRNVTLSGIDCVYASNTKRKKAWNLIEKKLNFKKLKLIKSEKNISDISDLSKKILKGKIKGRTLISLKKL